MYNGKRTHIISSHVLVIILLAAGCSGGTPTPAPTTSPTLALPTAAATQEAIAVVTSTATPTETQPPPSPTPVLHTATNVPPTATPEPPTATPVPPSPTCTPLSPTTTATPAPTATSIAESYFDGVRVTFVNNAGFLITAWDKRILIDALYEGYPEGILKPVVYAQPPFDGVDLILATHDHLDHFSPELVLRYMKNNPETVFVSTLRAVRKLRALDGGIQDRVIPIVLKAGEREQIVVKGIDLEAIYLSHGYGSVPNLGFIISVEGIKLFHTGDIDPDIVTVPYLQSYGLPEKQIDIAFVAAFFLLDKEYHPLALEGIQARYLIPMHYDYQTPPTGIEADFPNAIVFQDTMESWVLPSATGTSQPAPTEAPPQVTLTPELPTASPALGDTWTRSTDGMVMIYVPGGTFQMGSTDAQIDEAMALCEQYPDEYGKCEVETFEEESPQHAVTLDGFWIDRTEVTNAQYTLCVADGACRKSRLADQPAYNDDDYPVAGIPWQDAADYCGWSGGRLPTEAEWEYAARGPEGRVYPWGDEFDCGRGNFWDDATGCDDGYREPAPVGSFPTGASWCGALDMAGNAWEWVADVYGPYPAEAETDPAGPATGSERILRGGSWGYLPAFVRSAYRYPVPPTANYLAVGFRCVVPSGE
jgi:formylglycine-generating enzyme required for sulfatase activity/L-ascorbate metabolism protein UlaG (beta-lactamase superfamily)